MSAPPHDTGPAPADLPTQRQRIAWLIERERLPQAREVLAQALGEHPDDVGLRCQAGQLEYVAGRHAEAAAMLESLLADAPGHAFARYVLAWCYYRLQRFAASEELLLGLLRESPEEARYLAAYAQLMLTTGHLDKADRLAREAVRQAPDSATALSIAAVSAFVHNPHDAAARHTLEQLVARYPNTLHTLETVTALLVNARRYREALPLAQEMLRARPQDDDVAASVLELKATTHWSMLPLWPMTRFGWAGVAAVWALWLLLLRGILPNTPLAPLAGALTVVFLVYVAYSWIWPGALKRFLK